VDGSSRDCFVSASRKYGNGQRNQNLIEDVLRLTTLVSERVQSLLERRGLGTEVDQIDEGTCKSVVKPCDRGRSSLSSPLISPFLFI
jgi:hypothetical protein